MFSGEQVNFYQPMIFMSLMEVFIVHQHVGKDLQVLSISCEPTIEWNHYNPC